MISVKKEITQIGTKFAVEIEHSNAKWQTATDKHFTCPYVAIASLLNEIDRVMTLEDNVNKGIQEFSESFNYG